MTIEHKSTIEIDAPEGYLELDAEFEIWNEKAYLYNWNFNGNKQSRLTMQSLIGEDELQRIEELVYTEWMESENG